MNRTRVGIRWWWVAIAGLMGDWGMVCSATAEAGGADPERIEAVASMLVEHAAGFGCPIADRGAWDALARTGPFTRVVRRAERLLRTPLPDQPDALYLDFSRTGNRTRWQKVAGHRRGRVRWFVLAECIENRARFIPPVVALMRALADEPTWLMPAHDASLANFKGRRVDIDLGSAMLAWNLATADHVLGDRLPDDTRRLIRQQVQRRIFKPFGDMVAGRRKPNWWMHSTNNWNAVCLAGVTGSALALLDARSQRARFVVAAEHYSRHFLEGFTPDGYCSEGVGYWNYGFGHYVLLGEAVRRATRGRIDLLGRPAARAPATYASRIEIMGGVCPSFADCSVRARPD